MAVVNWDTLTREQAEDIARRWLADGPGRLDWLTANAGAFTFDQPGASQVWAWYLDWKRKPRSSKGQPPPAWWTPKADDKWCQTDFASDTAVGADAVMHFNRVLMLATAPALRDVVPINPKRGTVQWLNQPCLEVQGGPDGYVKRFPLIAPWISLFNAAEARRRGPEVDLWAHLQRTLHSVGVAFSVLGQDTTGRSVGQPAPSEPPFTIESWPLAGADWQVGFRDDIASDNQDLIAKVAEALRRLATVQEVEHSEREVLLVTATGTLTQAEIEHVVVQLVPTS